MPAVDGGASSDARPLRDALRLQRIQIRLHPHRPIAKGCPRQIPEEHAHHHENTVIRLNWTGDVLKKIRADFAPWYCLLASPSTSVLAEPREKRAEQRRTAR